MTFESNTVTKNFLKRNVTARFVRFWPKEWHGRRYMRVEVYGCKGKNLKGPLEEDFSHGVVSGHLFNQFSRQTRLMEPISQTK